MDADDDCITLDVLIAALEQPRPQKLFFQCATPRLTPCLRNDEVFRLVSAVMGSDLVSDLKISDGTLFMNDQDARVRSDGQTLELVLTVNMPHAVASLVCRSLRHNTSLASLNLFGIDTDEADAAALAAALAENCALRSLVLVVEGDKAMLALAAALAGNSTLHTLDIGMAHSTYVGLLALCDAVGANRGLKTLSLYRFEVMEDGGRAVGAALARNTCLEKLELCDCFLSEAGVAALASGLARNSRLLRFCLSGADLNDTALDVLANALAQHPRLQLVSLVGCNVDDGMAGAFLRGLAGSSGPTALDRAGEGPASSTAAATAASAALPGAACLVELDLSENAIGDAGAATIGKMLEHNGTLQRLVLAKNQVGAAGARALGQGLARNRSLVHLDLDNNNGIGTAGVRDLCTSLSQNTTLASLHVLPSAPGNAAAYAAPAVAAAAIAELLRCNTSMTSMPYAEKLRTEGKAFAALLASNALFHSAAAGHAHPAVARPLASLWIVLTAIRTGGGSARARTDSPVLPSNVNDLIFSLSRAVCPEVVSRIRERWVGGRALEA